MRKVLSILFFTLFLISIPSTINAQVNYYTQFTCSAFAPGYCGSPTGCYDTTNCKLPAGGCQNYAFGTQSTCTGPHDCDCSSVQPAPTSSQLDLPALYNTIQSKPHAFSFSQSPGEIISILLRYVFPIVGLILLLMLIYGGYNIMLSGGDPKKAAMAKSIITTAAVGFVLIFSAYWIVKIVANILGLGDIQSLF